MTETVFEITGYMLVPVYFKCYKALFVRNILQELLSLSLSLLRIYMTECVTDVLTVSFEHELCYSASIVLHVVVVYFEAPSVNHSHSIESCGLLVLHSCVWEKP